VWRQLRRVFSNQGRGSSDVTSTEAIRLSSSHSVLSSAKTVPGPIVLRICDSPQSSAPRPIRGPSVDGIQRVAAGYCPDRTAETAPPRHRRGEVLKAKAREKRHGERKTQFWESARVAGPSRQYGSASVCVPESRRCSNSPTLISSMASFIQGKPDAGSASKTTKTGPFA